MHERVNKLAKNAQRVRVALDRVPHCFTVRKVNDCLSLNISNGAVGVKFPTGNSHIQRNTSKL